MKGLVVEDKATRISNFHEETVKSFIELMAASGAEVTTDLKRSHINRRISMNKVLTYAEIYPETKIGSLL